MSSGFNSGSNQTLEFEFGSGGALGRLDEILDSKVGSMMRSIVCHLTS